MATTGTVVGIISNLVVVKVNGPVSQNEICYINHRAVKLMAEVIRIGSENAYIQVFESTRGLKTGTPVEFTGHMLEAILGTGILSKNFDGLQHDLDKMEGVFLQKGDYTHPLEVDKDWRFKPLAKVGDEVEAGSWLGEVTENWIAHKIMVPFTFEGEFKVKNIGRRRKQ
jgi:V/A-type H+-transporting ATPase subunit A